MKWSVRWVRCAATSPARAATTCMAVAQAVSGQTEAGTATLDQALALLDAPGVTATGRLDGLMRLASMLARLKRLDEALAMQEQVLVAARERGIVPMQIESLRFMAAIRASEFDDPQGALPYFRQAYDLHRALVGANGAIHPPLSYDLGYTLMNLGQYEEADAKFTEAATGAAAIPELAGMGDLIASHRAEIARLRGDPGAAEPQLAAVLLRQRVAGDLAGEAVTSQSSIVRVVWKVSSCGGFRSKRVRSRSWSSRMKPQSCPTRTVQALASSMQISSRAAGDLLPRQSSGALVAAAKVVDTASVTASTSVITVQVGRSTASAAVSAPAPVVISASAPSTLIIIT